MQDSQTLEAGTIARLAVGSTLRLLGTFPAYRVTEMHTDSQPPSILLALQPGETDTEKRIAECCPPTIRVEGEKPFVLGRSSASDVQFYSDPPVEELQALSRIQGVIQYTPQQGFVYMHSGRHKGMAEGVEIIDKDANVSIFTKEDMRVPEERATLDVPLHAGTRIAFHHTLPIYTVTALDATHRTLRLERDNQQQDKRSPAHIEVNGTPLAIGRGKDNDVILISPVVSSKQGTIGWSDEQQGFVYHSIGKAVPVVHASGAFLDEQHAICERLQPAAAEEAKAEWAHINDLLKRINTYQRQMSDVKDLEVSVIGGIDPKWVVGGRTEDSQVGYALWLESLGVLYREDLSPEQQKNITKMTDVIRQLADDRAELREIEDKHKIKPYAQYNRDDYPYSAAVQAYADRKQAELERDGAVYMVSGYRGHHTVSRIRKTPEDDYLLTVYNAGAEARPAPKGKDNPDGSKVMGIYEQKIKHGKDVPELIRQITEMKIRPFDFDQTLSKGIDALVKPKVVRYKAVKPQTRGNCTTRSTRHMLEDALGDELVQKFGRYVAEPEVSIAEDLKNALLIRREKLEAWSREHGDPITPDHPEALGGPERFIGPSGGRAKAI